MTAIARNKDSVPPNMSEAEWRTRIDCAAGHRLLDLYGLTDLVEGLVGTRVAEESDAFLLKPYRLFFDEVRASDLIKVRFDERPDTGPGQPLNYASVNQTRYFLQARPDINCVLHTHTDATAVVASLAGGLVPMTQHAFIVAGHLTYVDFDVAIDDACMEKTIHAMGDKKILLMRNHGMMVLGANVAEAFFLARTLDVACRCQVSAMHTGANILRPEPPANSTVDQIIHDYATHEDHLHIFNGSLQWDGLLRKLDREDASYKD